MFPFGGIIMNNYVVKTISAGVWQATKELLDKCVQECARGRDIKCQVLINIFSCKSWGKLIKRLNLQHMECPQLPLKSRISESRLVLPWWGDTSPWQLIGALCTYNKGCRTAAAGKPPEGQGGPTVTQAFGQIHVHSWATNPPEISKSPSWAAFENKSMSQLLSITVFTQTITFFPRWNVTVNSNAQEKNTSEWDKGRMTGLFSFYFLFIELEFKS